LRPCFLAPLRESPPACLNFHRPLSIPSLVDKTAPSNQLFPNEEVSTVRVQILQSHLRQFTMFAMSPEIPHRTRTEGPPAQPEENQSFPLRTYNPVIIGGAAIFFFGFGIVSAWLLGRGGDYGWAVGAFLIWSSIALLFFRLLQMNRQRCELTGASIALTYPQRSARCIVWRDVEKFDVWRHPAAGWRFTLRGRNRSKIEIDASTPKFRTILELVQRHLVASGNQMLIETVPEGFRAQR
jgi:hypothetical protein